MVLALTRPRVWRNRPMVLIADDDRAYARMIAAVLEGQGFDSVLVDNGEAALSALDQQAPDIVLVDALMPGLSGFETIEGMRQRPNGAHLPIMLMTGQNDVDAIDHAFHAGATDFIAKPVPLASLSHRLNYMLRAAETASELRRAHLQLDTAQRIAKLGYWEWNVVNDEIRWSVEFARLFGILDERRSAPLSRMMQDFDVPEFEKVSSALYHAVEQGLSVEVEFSYQIPNGEMRTYRMEARPNFDDEAVCVELVGTVQDVSNRNKLDQQVHNLAYYDVVTGLPNRARLQQLLDSQFQRARRDSFNFALLFLDLDHFKAVNDTHGHDIGDLLLQRVADRLREVVRESDNVGRDVCHAENAIARLGGDEFVVLLSHIEHSDDAARVATRIGHAMRTPFQLDGREVQVSTTIGISVYPADGRDSATMIKHADIAMYHAKESGRDGFQFYSRSIHDRALVRIELERALRDAIDGDELSLVFQPKIDRFGEVIGFEVLSRWHHPEFGMVPPKEFIAIAEDANLVDALGERVLLRACRQLREWESAGLGRFSLAVNCADRQFRNGTLNKAVVTALEDSGIEPSQLELEVTEQLFVQHPEEADAALAELKSLGVCVAIDDFGTGYSSLRMLKNLRVDTLRVDRSFVARIHEDRGDAAIVTTIITLANELGMKVAAEGVENEAQRLHLEAHGCDEFQGYLIAPPMPAEEVLRWLEQYRRQPLPSAANL